MASMVLTTLYLRSNSRASPRTSELAPNQLVRVSRLLMVKALRGLLEVRDLAVTIMVVPPITLPLPL